MTTAAKTINITDEKLPCPCCHGSGQVLNRHVVGLKMQAYRKNKGVYLRAVAEKCGFSYGYVNDLENGRRPWDDEKVEKFKAAVDALAKPVQAC